jgi:hypothetical protein
LVGGSAGRGDASSGAVDAAVRVIDPDAAKERRVRADDDRHISVTPLPDGMALVRGA